MQTLLITVISLHDWALVVWEGGSYDLSNLGRILAVAKLSRVGHDLILQGGHDAVNIRKCLKAGEGVLEVPIVDLLHSLDVLLQLLTVFVCLCNFREQVSQEEHACCDS